MLLTMFLALTMVPIYIISNATNDVPGTNDGTNIYHW